MKRGRQRRWHDILLVALVVLALVSAAGAVARHARQDALAALPAMRDVDPQVIEKAMQNGSVSDHEARHFRPYTPASKDAP